MTLRKVYMYYKNTTNLSFLSRIEAGNQQEHETLILEVNQSDLGMEIIEPLHSTVFTAGRPLELDWNTVNYSFPCF